MVEKVVNSIDRLTVYRRLVDLHCFTPFGITVHFGINCQIPKLELIG